MMDVGDILEKMPSVEQLFGLAWVGCWFLAIWIFHLQFFLTGLFCLFLALLISGNLERGKEHKNHKSPALITMDKSTRTLKVQKLYEKDLRWDDYEVCSGLITLPSGQVKEGDVLKNCKGNVALRHIPSNKLTGGYEFD
jgi:hypothetical protein